MRSSGAAGNPAPRPAPYVARGTTWWAMLLLLFVLVSMLAALLFSYFYLRAGFATWPPPPAEEPALAATAAATALLILSAAPMATAHLAARSGTAGARMSASLAAVLVLAAAFLLLQWVDYRANDIDPQRDVYGSLFLALAGFHHVNTALAVVGVALVLFRVGGGRLSPREQEMAVTAAHYWYFVVGSWLVIGFTLYVTPRLW